MQQVELFIGQIDSPAGPLHAPFGDIQPQVGHREKLFAFHLHAAPQRGTDAGEQFGKGEGLDELIVRP